MVYPIIIDVKRKGGGSNGRVFEGLGSSVISSLVTVAAETAIQALKEKTSRKAGKHAKRS
jgi:hypothetical protein